MKQRNSSVEVLRIIAMAFVLLTHWNWSMLKRGGVNFEEQTFIVRYLHCLIEAPLVICVNLFIIISGYYGLKLKAKSIINIGILVSTVFLVEYFYLMQNGQTDFSIKGLIKNLLFISRSDYFVVDYILLLFVSPILNAFINNNNRKTILIYTLLAIVIESYFGCVRPNIYIGINRGYSFIHFVIIYLVARCLNLYKDELFKRSRLFYTIIFCCCSALISLSLYFNVNHTTDYCNPLVVLSAASFFIIFAKGVFYNKFVNTIAASTFAVYIVHRYNPIHDIMQLCDIWLFENYNYLQYWLLSLPVLLAIFFGAILIDKIIDLYRKPILKCIDKLNIPSLG